jgi:hypothetical protein
MSTLGNKFTHEHEPVLEPERYEFHEAPIHHFALDRRDFFKFFGAGIMVFAAAKDALALQESGGSAAESFRRAAQGNHRLAAHRRRRQRHRLHRKS